MSASARPKRHPYNQWSPDARALDLAGDKWTLLIVRDLLCGPLRFVELQRVLPGISTEQLRSRLNRMVADGLLTRRRYREVPPRVEYELTDSGRELIGVVSALARWGFRWAWGTPRPGERVDLGALLRAASGLLGDLHAGADGARAITLEVTDHEPRGDHAYSLELGPDGPRLREGPAPGAAACVRAREQEWVAALASPPDRPRLEVSGDRELAEAVLARLRAYLE